MSLGRCWIILLTCAAACGPGREPRAGAARVSALPPADSGIPAGPLGASIRRGLALVTATRESLPAFVGGGLRCVSCHLDEGRRAQGSWVGVYGRYPQYRARSGTVETIEYRVNDCFRRSLNGAALPVDGPDLRDIVAYLAFLSRGTAIGAPAAPADSRWAGLTPDPAAGGRFFASTCTRCHGVNGEGSDKAPPLWGPRSFNIGAGMTRLRTAAGFIRANMPFDRAVILTDQQAIDVAAYINARPRPDFPGKERDWPHADAPPDAAYPTLAQPRLGRQ